MLATRIICLRLHAQTKGFFFTYPPVLRNGRGKFFLDKHLFVLDFTKMSTYCLLFPSKQRCSKFKTQFRGAGTCCHEWPSANIDRGGGGGEETSLGKVCFCLPRESEPLSVVCDALGGREIRQNKAFFVM